MVPITWAFLDKAIVAVLQFFIAQTLKPR